MKSLDNKTNDPSWRHPGASRHGSARPGWSMGSLLLRAQHLSTYEGAVRTVRRTGVTPSATTIHISGHGGVRNFLREIVRKKRWRFCKTSPARAQNTDDSKGQGIMKPTVRIA